MTPDYGENRQVRPRPRRLGSGHLTRVPEMLQEPIAVEDPMTSTHEQSIYKADDISKITIKITNTIYLFIYFTQDDKENTKPSYNSVDLSEVEISDVDFEVGMIDSSI